MRIVHLNTHDSGGSWVYARTLSDALCAAGHDSVVHHRELAERPLSDKILRRASLAMAHGAWHGTRRTLPPPAADSIHEADVVHLHTVADWFDVPRWLGTLPSHVQLVVGMHDLWHASGGCFVYDGCDRFQDACRPCPLLRAPANLFFARNELRRKTRAYHLAGAHFVANSKWLREIVKNSSAIRLHDIAVVPPPVDPTIFSPQDRASCREKFGLQMDDVVIATGCASLTDANKDTPGLMRMIGELDQTRLKVLIFGDGEIPLPPGISVQRLGSIRDKRDLATIYGASDVFASASRMETYGLTLAEAYACGCAVVAHATGGIPEALPADPSVSLVPLTSPAAFVHALREQFIRCTEKAYAERHERAAPCAPSPSEAVEALMAVYSKPLNPIFRSN